MNNIVCVLGRAGAPGGMGLGGHAAAMRRLLGFLS